MKVAIEYIDWIIEERAKINRANLRDIEFYKDGMRIDIPEKILSDFECIGLSNIDLITSGFYKTGFTAFGKNNMQCGLQMGEDNMRKGDIEFRWSDTNKKHELVKWEESGKSCFVIAFFDKCTGGYDMRTVGERFFLDHDAWFVAKHAIRFLNDIFDEE